MADAAGAPAKLSDKDERKKARRAKVEAKKNPVEQKAADNGPKETDDRTGASQIAESVVHLDRRKYIGLQDKRLCKAGQKQTDHPDQSCCTAHLLM